MEVTMTEMLLFAWAIFATAMWQQTKHDFRVHRIMTMEVFKRVAQGKIKVLEHDDSFELKEVKQ